MNQVAVFSCTARADVVTVSTILTRPSRRNCTKPSLKIRLPEKLIGVLLLFPTLQLHHVEDILINASNRTCRCLHLSEPLPFPCLYYPIILDLGISLHLIALFGVDGGYPLSANKRYRHCSKQW